MLGTCGDPILRNRYATIRRNPRFVTGKVYGKEMKLQINEFSDPTTQALLVVVIVIVAVLALVGITSHLLAFIRELRYLNSEIERTDGREQRHWKRLRRRLWLSLLPFFRY